jgi:hypothetical protein
MTKEQLKLRLTAAGSHFFDKATMRFFGSRLCEVLPTTPSGHVYFVTSEARPGFNGYAYRSPAGPRLYTVRVWDGESADTETIGEFQQYTNRRAAVNAAKRAAKVP